MMRRFRIPRGIPIALIGVLLLVSQPAISTVRAESPCGSWKTTIDPNEKRIGIDPFAGFQGSGCETAFQIHDRAGSVTITVPFTNISFTSQIAGYTLEMNVTGSDNADVTNLGGNAIPGIDDELHLKPKDSGANAKVTLDGSVTAKSLSVDMLLLMMNTIFDELGLPGKCIPYAYVYGLVVDYIPTIVKAAGYLLQPKPQVASAVAELNRIRDDVMKGMVQKIVDTIGSAGIGCLPDAAIGIAKRVGLHLLTGGADFALVAGHAVANVMLTGGFIIKDWATNQGHAIVTLDYTSGQPAPPAAQGPTLVQVAFGGTDANVSNYVIGWNYNGPSVTGFHIYRFGTPTGKGGGPLTPIATTDANARSFSDKSSIAGVCYYVGAFGSAGESHSDSLCIEQFTDFGRTKQPPPAPTNGQISEDGTKMTWSPSDSTAIGYRIGTDSKGTLGVVASPFTTLTPVHPIKVVSGTCFAIVAYNYAGESSPTQACA